MRATHTMVMLPVSDATYREIELAFKAAGYDHALLEEGIDMHGVGLERKPDDTTRRVAPVGKTNFELVGDFHAKFDLARTEEGLPAALVGKELFDFRHKFMQEELDEMREAYERKDLAGVADAIVDLLYVAYGTAHLMRLPTDDLFELVHRANMQKQRAQKDGSDSKRGSAFDVVKPPGWQPPDVAGMLEFYNEECRKMHEGSGDDEQ